MSSKDWEKPKRTANFSESIGKLFWEFVNEVNKTRLTSSAFKASNIM
jgi:hypothetical protein